MPQYLCPLAPDHALGLAARPHPCKSLSSLSRHPPFFCDSSLEIASSAWAPQMGSGGQLGQLAEEGRAAAGQHHRAEASQLAYGAAGTGRPDDDAARARRPPDRLGAILGGIAVVALTLGLVQIADVGGGSRAPPRVRELGSKQQLPGLEGIDSLRRARLRHARGGSTRLGIKMGSRSAILQEVAAAAAPSAEPAAPTASEGAKPEAEQDVAAGAANSTETPREAECCACEDVQAATAMGEEEAAQSGSAAGNPTTEPAAANASEPEPVPSAAPGPAGNVETKAAAAEAAGLAQADAALAAGEAQAAQTAKARLDASGQIQSARKLLWEKLAMLEHDAVDPGPGIQGAEAGGGAPAGNGTAVPVVAAAGVAAESAAAAPRQAAATPGCCACKDQRFKSISRRLNIEDVRPLTNDALPRTWWDDSMKMLKRVGKPMWSDGYKDAYDLDGVKLVHRTDEELDKVYPSIGPRDIVVPSLEYEGSDHDAGWVVKTDDFGDGHGSLPKRLKQSRAANAKWESWVGIASNNRTADESDHGGVEKELRGVLGVIDKMIPDKFVDQRITRLHDPANARGRQLPGVTVDWSHVPHPTQQSRQGPPTSTSPHIVHRANGRIQFQTLPLGSSVPYRGSVRSVTFKPCKKHPIHGCEKDPPMPGQIPERPPPLQPLVTDGTIGPPPKFTVDQEGRRFALSMFDDAAVMNDAPGPITPEMVSHLVLKYRTRLYIKPYDRWYLNVLDYMREEYDTTPAAANDIKKILADHHYHVILSLARSRSPWPPYTDTHADTHT